MEFLLYIPAAVFVVLTIYIIARVIRYGENNPSLTKAASIIGIVAGMIYVASSIFTLIFYKGGILDFLAAVFCLAFAFALKFIVRFFEDDFDKKHQIPVDEDNSPYRFDFKQDNSDNFFDESARFNGEFKDFDDDD